MRKEKGKLNPIMETKEKMKVPRSENGDVAIAILSEVADLFGSGPDGEWTVDRGCASWHLVQAEVKPIMSARLPREDLIVGRSFTDWCFSGRAWWFH